MSDMKAKYVISGNLYKGSKQVITGYLADSRFCKNIFTTKLQDARLFNSNNEAGIYIQTTFETDNQDFGVVNYHDTHVSEISPERLTIQQTLDIVVWQLKEDIRIKANLHKDTPFKIIADMYEDKGMIEEVNILRGE